MWLWTLRARFILRLEQNLAPLLQAKGMTECGHGANLLSCSHGSCWLGEIPVSVPLLQTSSIPVIRGPLMPHPFSLSPFPATACLFCRGL